MYSGDMVVLMKLVRRLRPITNVTKLSSVCKSTAAPAVVEETAEPTPKPFSKMPGKYVFRFLYCTSFHDNLCWVEFVQVSEPGINSSAQLLSGKLSQFFRCFLPVLVQFALLCNVRWDNSASVYPSSSYLSLWLYLDVLVFHYSVQFV